MLSFFCIYSQRFVVYDFLNSHNLYSDTLSNSQIQEVQKYLEKNIDVFNENHRTKVQKEVSKLLPLGSYSFHAAKIDSNDNVNDSLFIFHGRAPLDNISKYRIHIKLNKNVFIDWFPSFTNYYSYYCIGNCILSFCVSILFFVLHKKAKPFHHKKKILHTLSSKMLFTFCLATLIVFSSFGFMYINKSTVFEWVMDTFYQSENYDSYAKNMQKQLINYTLTKENKKSINKILKSNEIDHASTYIYDQNGDYFTGKSSINQNSLSFYTMDESEVEASPLYYEYAMQFKDQSGFLYITSCPIYMYEIPYLLCALFISFSFYMILLQDFIKKRVSSIQILQSDVFSLAIGDWNHKIQVQDNDEIGQLAEDLNQMRLAFLETMENEQQARIANKELISSLSHDLRTPLTTLKGYLEIMNLKKEDVDLRNQYLQKCLNKVEEITYLSNKMFEYSLVFSTEYSAELQIISIEMIIDTLIDHIQYLRELDLNILYDPLHTNASLQANLAMMQRILNNVFSNIQKYCDPWKEILIQTSIEENQFVLSFTNSINHHLEKVESNGIGLKSVQKMVQLQHGSFFKNQSEDLFTVVLKFPIHS